MITWTIIFFVHYINAICFFCSQNGNANKIIHIIIFFILLALFIFILVTAAFNLWAKSKALTSPQESND